jgi:hypothetical protein
VTLPIVDHRMTAMGLEGSCCGEARIHGLPSASGHTTEVDELPPHHIDRAAVNRDVHWLVRRPSHLEFSSVRPLARWIPRACTDASRRHSTMHMSGGKRRSLDHPSPSR